MRLPLHSLYEQWVCVGNSYNYIRLLYHWRVSDEQP